MNSLCIIPARGGSKRIPRKNIREFCGKPIIEYSIEVARRSGLFGEIMVSTDDHEIAAIAVRAGANVPFLRSEKNANDYATTSDVLLEVLQAYEDRGQTFDLGCCIYPTAPLVRTHRLQEGFDMLVKSNADAVFPIVRYSYPIGRALQIDNRKVSMIWPENMAKRSQDLPAAFHDAGQWYWFSCASLFRARKLWTDNTYAIEIDGTEVQDIDYPIDWLLAELKFKLTK